MGMFLDPLRLEDIDGQHMRLLSDFRYRISKAAGTVHVYPDFVTDFASVPRIFWTLLPACGAHNRAAVAHDWLYARRTVEMPDGSLRRPERAECDWIFLCALKDCGVSWPLRNLMWMAVRSPGGAYVWAHGEGGTVGKRGGPWVSREMRRNTDRCQA